VAQDILQGQWKQMRGQMKEWWGKLTDNDLEQAQGNYDKLVGLLQEKYGYTKVQAEAEVNKRMNDYKMQHGSSSQSTGYQQGHGNRSM
jgi:uncharacterized protein YjbJ (UPF0337 family)